MYIQYMLAVIIPHSYLWWYNNLIDWCYETAIKSNWFDQFSIWFVDLFTNVTSCDIRFKLNQSSYEH